MSTSTSTNEVEESDVDDPMTYYKGLHAGVTQPTGQSFSTPELERPRL